MHRTCFGLCAALSMLLPHVVWANFVNGTETFRGTQLDLQTWAISLFNPGATITQNNGLSIHAFSNSPPFAGNGYTTIAPLVPVGGSAWGQVRVDNAGTLSSPTFANFDLDTDPNGVLNFINNSVDLDVTAAFDGSHFFEGILGGERQTANGIETSFGPAFDLSGTSAVYGSPYIFQIERLSASNVRFSLFSELGAAADGGIKIALMNSGVQTFVSSSAPMYLSLQAIGTDTTFLSVTVNQPISVNQTEVFVPEPAMLSGLVPLILGVLNRRIRET